MACSLERGSCSLARRSRSNEELTENWPPLRRLRNAIVEAAVLFLGRLLSELLIELVCGEEFLFEIFVLEVALQMFDGLAEPVERARDVVAIGEENVAPDAVGAS